MPLSMTRLRKLVDGKGLKYFVAPDGQGLMLLAMGLNGLYQFLILPQLEGQFMQFRTLSHLRCPPDHKRLSALLKTIADIGVSHRLVKYGWNAADGEVVAFVDAWIMDGSLTQQQFDRMIENYLAVLDVNYPRLMDALDPCEDPGRRPKPPPLPPEPEDDVSYTEI